MITKIELNKVASYRVLSALETDKKVNLIYGLNGTGKSILSNFLYDSGHPAFSECSIEGLNNEDILVYNEKFIQEYFHESDIIKGIFTLSKENKESEEKIRNAQDEISAIQEKRTSKSEEIDKVKDKLSKKKEDAENTIWEIKTTYTGGDRVLEFCIDRLKSKKERLFDHISSISKPERKPDKTTDELKREVESFHGENAKRYSNIPTISFSRHHIEDEPLFLKEIAGNENSTAAGLIRKLHNSDWVKQGLEYLPANILNENEFCPFCQEKTITQNIICSIRDYFDESYENDIKELSKHFSDYKAAVNSIHSREAYETNPFEDRSKVEFENRYNQTFKILDGNIRSIESKIKSPSQPVVIEDSSDTIHNLNQLIDNINQRIDEHNNRIDNEDESLNRVKDTFWKIMRWDYDQTLSAYQTEKGESQDKSKALTIQIGELDSKIAAQERIIRLNQKNTINVDEAITSINIGLIGLGIDCFKIVKQSDILYKIVREEKDSDTFQTLSEGEKMIISFLYFLELCKGKKSASDTGHKKIIVIDDPISSLSHIFIFNIGELIKTEFLHSNRYEQVFVLTHSLYFFYELTDTNHKRRKENQKLFRLIKNSDGSKVLNMKYEEIQNDYHSFWQIVKDDKQPSALIANCMRQIIEYFFNFIEKNDFNNVFQKPVLQDNKYQAFRRYMSRESHSLGQNIFDYKEFNYIDFKDALRLVFMESGYPDHYEKMINR